MREFLCNVPEFSTPFKVVRPPVQKLPSNEAQRRGLDVVAQVPFERKIGLCFWVLVAGEN